MTASPSAPVAPPASMPQPVVGLPDPGERVPPLAWPTAALYVGALVLFGVEVYGYLVAGWSPWLTVPLGAAVTFLMFSVLHESAHHAVSTDTRVNDAFGHLAMPFVAAYTTFPMLKFIHIEHHRNTNEPKGIDPDSWTSEGPAWQLPLRWATVDFWYVAFYVRRLPDRPRAEVAGVLTMVAAAAAAVVALVAAGHGAELVLLYLLPQRIGMTVLAWWFDYLPHHGLTVTQRQDKYRATRIRVGGESWLTPLFVYQNYHLVHHLHPSVPFYRYLRAWRRNEQAYLDRNAAISTWFGRSLTPEEYRTWRRITDGLTDGLTDGRPGGADGEGRRPAFHPLRVRSVDPLTPESVVVTFDVPDDLAGEYRYVHGQHVTLRAVVGGVDVRRSYSIVAPVSAQTLSVAVKRVDDGVFSSYVTGELAAGDILDVMTPTGRFTTELDASQARRYVAVAAGSGITPLMSIVSTILEEEPDSTVTLVYGNRDRASTMFRDELGDLARTTGRLEVHHVLSREADPDGRVVGRVSPELVRELVAEPAGVHAWFLCGPASLVSSVEEAVASVPGVDPTRVLSEVFHTEPSTSAVDVDVESAVTVRLDGAESTFPLRSSGDTVLDAALQQGVEPPYSCAGGACGTCRAKVVLGRAVMDQNHALDDDEVADGYVLTCQAHPVTEELRVDYDA
ncbi:fatty acid desaturase [Nocardioides sp. SYSU DS0663]|uniref:fatty acid desaturase n=1 Tax=Nocardioides sp. SYSU DS0663 TaxID=3416445 RepID=UPI003F4C2F2B